MDLFKEYRFEAAHFLPRVPDGHPCGRMHGHSYRVVLHVTGKIQTTMGWVIDFAQMDESFQPIRAKLDHSVLNDLEDLDNPTCETLAVWIFRSLADRLPGLVRIECWETADAGCAITADDAALA